MALNVIKKCLNNDLANSVPQVHSNKWETNVRITFRFLLVKCVKIFQHPNCICLWFKLTSEDLFRFFRDTLSTGDSCKNCGYRILIIFGISYKLEFKICDYSHRRSTRGVIKNLKKFLFSLMNLYILFNIKTLIKRNNIVHL